MENYMEENYMKGYLTRQEIINLIKEQLNYELNLAQIIEVQEKLGIIPKKIFNKSNNKSTINYTSYYMQVLVLS